MRPRRLADALEPVRTDGYDATSPAGGFSSDGLNIVVSGRAS